MCKVEETVDLSGVYYDAKYDEILLIEPCTYYPYLDDHYVIMPNEKGGVIMSTKAVIDDMMDGTLIYCCQL